MSDNKCFKKEIYQYSIEELITWMITVSDNSSTNVLIKYLGFEKINKYFKEIGLKDTKLERYMLDEEAINKGKNNYTSLNDMYKCFKYIINKEILTNEFCDLALSILYKQKINNQINKYIRNIKFLLQLLKNYIISNLANFAINLLCPTLSKLISTFKSSPSCSAMLIVPSPNFLWKTLTPGLYLDKSTVSLDFLFKLFKKLSAVLKAKSVLFFTLLLADAIIGSFGFILYSFTGFLLPYVQLYEESLNI